MDVFDIPIDFPDDITPSKFRLRVLDKMAIITLAMSVQKLPIDFGYKVEFIVNLITEIKDEELFKINNDNDIIVTKCNAKGKARKFVEDEMKKLQNELLGALQDYEDEYHTGVQ